MGSPGDVVNLGAAGDWIDSDGNAGNGITGTAWAGTDGQNFTQFAAQNGALVYIETEIQTQFVFDEKLPPECGTYPHSLRLR